MRRTLRMSWVTGTVALAILTAAAAMALAGRAAAGPPGGWRVVAHIRRPTGVPTCDSTSDCWVPLGRSILATRDGGQVWRRRQLPGGRIATSVSCPTSLECFATVVGSYGRSFANPIIHTTDGGLTWTGDRVRGGVTGWSSIQCPSVLFCAALGQAPEFGTGCAPVPGRCVPIDAPAVAVTSDGGRSWTVTKNVMWSHGSTALYTVTYGMACPAVGVCYLAGFHSSWAGSRFLGNVGTVLMTRDGGRHWGSQPLPGGINLLLDISCVSARDCWAVGRTGETPSDDGVVIATTDGGAQWHRLRPPLGTAAMDSISCVDAGHCASLGVVRPAFASVIAASSDGGRDWPRRTYPGGVGGDIRCVTTTFCLAAVVRSPSDWTLEVGPG